MDLDKYTSEMAKSAWDKAFFMDKIPGVKCIIDFGCADGTMIHFLAPLFPDITFIGYDISDELIDRARATSPYYPNVVFFAASENNYGYQHVIDYVKSKEFHADEICINFSSVLHEVFSSTPEGKHVINYLITYLNPKYVTIRDMYFEGENKDIPYYHVADILSAFNVDRCWVEEFEDEFGSICQMKNLHHFLLKYQWKNNGWDEEMAENYFSWNIMDFLHMIGDYSVIFDAHYMLPYYREQWYSRNLYPLAANTHAQFILRRWTD